MKKIFDALLRNSLTEESFIEKVKEINPNYLVMVNFQKVVKDPSKQYMVMSWFGTISGGYISTDLWIDILNY